MDISSILKKYPKRREFVVEILHEIQRHDPQHFLSSDALINVAHHINLPLAQIYGIVSYYTMLSTKPRGKYLIQVCKSPVCSMMGSESVLDSLRATLKMEHSSQQENNPFIIEESECLGQCHESPCMMVNQKIYGSLTPEKIESIITGLKSS